MRPFLGRNLVLAIRFLVSTFDVLLRLFYRMDYSLNTCVPMVVWIGLACVRLLALARSSVFAVEVSLKWFLILVEAVDYG